MLPHGDTWPAHCRLFYGSVAMALRKAEQQHKKLSSVTYVCPHLKPYKRPDLLFTLGVSIRFTKKATKEEIAAQLRHVNSVNEALLARSVRVSIPNKLERSLFGDVVNPFCVTFSEKIPELMGDTRDYVMMYSDDGGEHKNTWSSVIAGFHMVEFLTKGRVSLNDTP